MGPSYAKLLKFPYRSFFTRSNNFSWIGTASWSISVEFRPILGRVQKQTTKIC